MPPSRRRFLGKLAATGVGTAVGIAVLPSPPSDQAALRPDELEAHPPDERPEITHERQTPYALFQYSREGGGYEPTSPINVIVTLDEDQVLFDVLSVLWDAGWAPRPVEYVRYAYNALEEQYERQHISAAQTYFGAFGRHHIRCWHFGDSVSIQAHQDTAATPEHKIVSYERTKHLLERLYHEAGWTVRPDGAAFDNDTDPDHDGLVTVITP